MKCEQCVKEGLKSCIYEDTFSGMRTLLYCHPYYDENGTYHHHDSNRTTFRYRCSNGHTFEKISYTKCPSCDWTNEPKKSLTYDEIAAAIKVFQTHGISGEELKKQIQKQQEDKE